MVAGTNKIISREMFFVIEIIAVSGLFSMGKHAIIQEINVSSSGIGINIKKEITEEKNEDIWCLSLERFLDCEFFKFCGFIPCLGRYGIVG